MNLIEELRGAVDAARAATDPAAVGKVYEKLVGYDLHADDPALSLDELKDMVFDYVRELCYANAVHVERVGLGGEQ
jgi:hypothetical protein